MRKTNIALTCAYAQMSLVVLSIALLAMSLLKPSFHDAAALVAIIVLSGYFLEDKSLKEITMHSCALFLCGVAYWAETPVIRTAFTIAFFLVSLRILRGLLIKRAFYKAAADLDRKIRSIRD